MDTPAEAKEITILFSDLSDFTWLSEHLGPELILQVLNDYLAQMNEVIFERGGTVDKFIGDAIMVLFGAPLEEPVEAQVHRAARCSLAMQARMRAFNEGLALRRHTAATNAHWPASRHGNRREFWVSPAVGLHRHRPGCEPPSRVETVAKPGTIFCTEAVHLHLGELSSRSAGLHEFKGVKEEQELYIIDF